MADQPQVESPHKEHRVFQSPGANARIWRYCSLAKFVSLLSNSALYFSLVSTLEDPFEGAMPRMLANLVARDVAPVLLKVPFTHFVNCWHLNDEESAGMWQL